MVVQETRRQILKNDIWVDSNGALAIVTCTGPGKFEVELEKAQHKVKKESAFAILLTPESYLNLLGYERVGEL